MQLSEADKLFATSVRITGVEKILADKKVRKVLLSGLEGSSAAMLFAGLKPAKHPSLIIADDLDTADMSTMTYVRFSVRSVWAYSPAATSEISNTVNRIPLRRYYARKCSTHWVAENHPFGMWCHIPRHWQRKWLMPPL